MTQQTRVFHLEHRGRHAGEYEVSLASDFPYDRGGYIEILAMSESAIDMSRARDGLPLLSDHSKVRLGRINNLHTDGKRLRGVLRFFDTAAGREARAEVDGGHREVSIGYEVLETRQTDKGEVIVTRWRPHEGSIVAVPADPTVGINRSFSKGPDLMNTQNTDAAAGALEGQASGHADNLHSRSQRRAASRQAADEAARVDTINATARAYGKWLGPTDASEAIANGSTPQDFNELIMRRMESGATDTTTLAGHPTETRSAFGGFSLARYVQSVVNPAEFMRSAGLEHEATRELGRQAPLALEGAMVPLSAIFPAGRQRDMSAGSSSLGGSFVQTSIIGGELIDALRARSVVVQLGARVLPGLRDPIALPKKTAATAAGSWLTETGTANATDVSTGQVTLSPKRISAYVVVSRQLLLTSTPVAVQNMIATDLRQTLEQELDRVAINGTGASNQPRGVRNAVGVGSVVGGTNGAQLAWSHILDLEAAVENADAMTDLASAGYAINGKTRSWLKRTMKVSGQPGGIIMGETPPDDAGIVSLNGYKALTSSKLPSNLTKGTASGVCSSVVFGCWSNLVIGQFGPGVEIIVDPYSLATTGQVRITANLFADVAVRNAVSFAVMDDALTV
ncbi:MAG: phage major capsid protein [Burkholderiaceae bacterium]|nr:phage major capsid protein [Burkholderiaceae bacterium]